MSGSNGRYRALIEHGLDLMILFDRDARAVYVSPSVERILGYSVTEYLETSGFDRVHPDDRDRVRAAHEALCARPNGTAHLEMRLRHANGSWCEIECTLHNMLDDPDVAALVGHARDVTERNRVQRELAESEERFRLIAENAPDVIARYQVQPVRRTEYISPSVEKITGYPPDEFYTNPDLHYRLIHPDDQAKLHALATNGSLDALREPLTLRWIHKDGSTVWMEQVIVPILDARGELVATECISRDVTEKMRLEEHLRQAQKMEAIGRLAGGIAHDFNNLLGVVLGCADMLRRHTPPDARTRNALHAIIDATKRGATLTRQLLTFSHRELVEPKILDINEVIEDVVPLLRRLIPENVDIRTVLDLDVGSIEIDQSQLEQVIINLAVRARDAMPDGGIMTVETFTPSVEPRRSSMVVRDTGNGMSEEERARVFEPFFTSRDNGRDGGLGMAVVYGIVKHSGGAIDCASAPGRGSRFELTWPSAARPRPGIRDAAEDAPRHGGSETVLVVEDETQLRLLIKDMLEEAGFTVLQAEDAEAALRLSERNPGRIDLLLTDLVMPRINGRELAERLAHAQPRLRVLFMSGYTDDEIVRQGVEMTDVSFLPKPFGIDELTDKIRRTLDTVR